MHFIRKAYKLIFIVLRIVFIITIIIFALLIIIMPPSRMSNGAKKNLYHIINKSYVHEIMLYIYENDNVPKDLSEIPFQLSSSELDHLKGAVFELQNISEKSCKFLSSYKDESFERTINVDEEKEKLYHRINSGYVETITTYIIDNGKVPKDLFEVPYASTRDLNALKGAVFELQNISEKSCKFLSKYKEETFEQLISFE